MSIAPTFLQAQGTPLLDAKGNMHPNWQNFFQQLTAYISTNISPEGLQAPSQNTSNITILNTPQSAGRFVYNTDNNTMMVNLNGTFKTIQTM